MLRPKGKTEKIKLSKSSIKKAKRIFNYLRPYRFSFFIGWIFLLFSSSAGLFFPYLLGQLLGASSSGRAMGGGIDKKAIFNNLSLNNIDTVALLLLCLFVLQSLFSFFRIVIFTRVTENTMRDIRKDAFQKLIYMPQDFFNRNKVGELTSRISADITLINDTLRTTIAEFFRQIVTITGSIIFIVLVSWRLSLIMIATVPVMILIAVVFGRFIKNLSKDAQDYTAKSNTVVEESLMGIINVKTFTNENFMIGRYRKAIDEIRRLNIRSGNWRGFFVSFIILCLFGAIVFIIWQGLQMTIGPGAILNKGDFFSFVMFTVFMGAGIGTLPNMYSTIQKAIGATEHLMDIIEEETEKEIHKGTLNPPIKGEVTFRNVDFSYPQRKDFQVLKNLSFTAKSGEKIAIVGASGAGKSTIASLILRFYNPSSGLYSIDNIDVSQIDLHHLRNNMALVPQEVILFSGTIRENILFGKHDASDEELRKAAEEANALSFIENFPDGFETEVGDRGLQLSGGQKQRIAIARAILKDPTILILDEATSALDSESESLIQQALDKLMENRTSFIIAHRLSTIRKADIILVLDNGRIVESGTHVELMAIADGVYANLNELQVN